MGLSLEEYASITYYHYELKCKGFRLKNLEQWKQIRQICFVTMTSSANADPKKLRGITPEIWWPLEQSEKKKEPTPIYKRKGFKEMIDKFKNLKR